MAVSPSFAFLPQADKIGYYATMPTAGSSWIVLLLRLQGLEADDTLADYGDLASLLLGTSDEAVFSAYERKPFVPTRTVNSAAQTITYAGASQITWQKAGSSTGEGVNDTVAKAVVAFKPSSTAADSAILPLFASSIRGTTDGNDMTWRLPNGLAVVDSLQAS